MNGKKPLDKKPLFFDEHPKALDGGVYGTIVGGSISLPILAAEYSSKSLKRDFLAFDKEWTEKLLPGHQRNETLSDIAAEMGTKITNGALDHDVGVYLFHALLFLVPLALGTRPLLYGINKGVRKISESLDYIRNR